MSNVKTTIKILSFIASNKTEFLDIVRKNTQVLVPLTVKVYDSLIEDRTIIVDTVKTYGRIKQEVVTLLSQWSDSETSKALKQIGKDIMEDLESEDSKDFTRRLNDFVNDRVSEPTVKEETVQYQYTASDSALLADCLAMIESRKKDCEKWSNRTVSIVALRKLQEIERQLCSLENGFICRSGGIDLFNYVSEVINKMKQIDVELLSLEM